jgi:DNA invertase Pin-like site-specific DNA recombinase
VFERKILCGVEKEEKKIVSLRSAKGMERVTTRGRPKGSRGRGKGKRGRKRQIVSDEDENIETNVNDEIQDDPVSENINVTQENIQEIKNATTETKSPDHQIAGNDGDVSISEADHEDEEVKCPSDPSWILI